MEGYGKILLVEDDLSLAQWIEEYLQEHGYIVTHVSSGNEVISAFKTTKPDLVLLDIMLPGIDGIQVCKELRAFSSVPVVMLTARSDELDEVVGLEVGADDYLTKPIRPRALVARIKTLIRNKKTAETVPVKDKSLEFGELYLDSNSKRVLYRKKEVMLSSGEFEFIWFLACNAGQPVNRDQVFLALKGREYDGQDRRFDLMISALRKKFDDAPQNPEKIKTIWGKGYLFVADAWA